MKNIIDYKMALYTFVIALVCVFLKTALSPSIPGEFSLIFAIALLLLGGLLSVFEVKNNLNFFYAFAENWHGNAIVNSGFIIGISNFFLAPELQIGVLFSFLLGIAVFLERTLIRRIIVRLNKNA